MDVTVSVVIPIYNTAPYLDRCIRSVAAQTHPHLEIILVDDGSTDASPDICEAWAGQDRRIRVIHTENRGQGIARNTGMAAATGSYICFFDSDDSIAPDTIEKACSLALAQAADIVVFGLTALDRSGRVIRSFPPKVGSRTYRGCQVLEEFLPEFIAPDPNGSGQQNFYMSACVMLYALPRLRQWGWQFISEREIISEDVYSLLALFHHAACVTVLPEAPYFYWENEASFSRSYLPNRYQRIRHFYIACTDLCDALGYSYNIRKRISSPYLAFTIAAIKQEAGARRPFLRRRAAIAAILQDDVLQLVLAETSHDRASPRQRLMFLAMRLRLCLLCFALASAQNLLDTHTRK